MLSYTYPLLSVIAVSIISFVGVFTLSLNDKIIKKYVFILVSLAVGALLGDAFIHLIPEAFESSVNAPLFIIAGILVFFIFEKILHWHHHSFEEVGEETVHATGKMILVSDGVHNLIDGLIIGASYLVSVEVGIASTLAIILHEIPQEIGDFGVLVHSGYSTSRALWLNFLTALTAVVGTIVALAIGGMALSFTVWLVPFAAGGFIYIALSDLMPELHKTNSLKKSMQQILAVITGIGIMILLLFIEG